METETRIDARVTPVRARRPRATALLVAAALATSGGIAAGASSDTTVTATFGLLQEPTLSERPDRGGLVFRESWEKGEPVSVEVGEAPRPYRERSAPKRVDEPKPKPAERLHPLLLEWLATRDGAERVDLIVSTEETLSVPRFPEPDTTRPRDAGINPEALERAGEIVEEMSERRRESNRELVGTLETLGAKVLREYWLVPSVRVSLPLEAVKLLLEDERVRYVEPTQSDELPPANGNPDDDVSDARALIQSDPYFNQGLTSGWIGLLDTGVHRDHELLDGPDRIALWRDCTSGDPNCLGGQPSDTCWNHGTSAAGIISGNANQGNAQRGVTGIMIDSWKVYPDNDGDCGGLSGDATVLAFQQAVRWLDRIIVAEMQGGGNASSTISLAADGAFDAGSAVIAANGNNGAGGSAAGSVNAPANAHRVIGIGAFDTESGAQYGNQSRGPTDDGRYKPDVQMPNRSETASTGCWFGVPCSPLSDTATRVFGGTSGAVPYGGGAAALARNWMRRAGQTDPGHVYARMIVAGQNPYPYDNTQGAGRAKLPIDGRSWWGKVTIADGWTVDIPVNVTRRGAHDLDGAIWWPESARSHDDIDLKLVSPSGVVIDQGISVNSVFERARAAGVLERGTWRVRIHGYDVRGYQEVYWNATVRN